MINVAILIPVYKKDLLWFEKISLERVVKIFRNRPIFFIAPNSLKFNYGYEYKKILICRFQDCFFDSISAYNKLMMSEDFYKKFFKYKFILIYQLDAFVFRDDLEYFCSLDYDYIGAPWLYARCGVSVKKRIYVGNGGFSLRKVESLCCLTKRRELVNSWKGNEDEFFAYYGKYERKLKIAPTNIARMFSFESPVARCYKKNNKKIPFGCHQWMRFGKEFYKKVFMEQCGIDLSAYTDYMEDIDCYDEKTLMTELSFERIFKNHSLYRYIYSSYEWSVIGIGTIGKRLCEELFYEKIKLNKLFDSDKEKQGKVFAGKTILPLESIVKGKDKIIIGSFAHSIDICKQLESMGLVYGDDFIDIGREYGKRILFGLSKKDDIS